MDPLNETLETYRTAFAEMLGRFDADAALDYCAGLLQQGMVTVPQLYESVLAPALNGIEMSRGEENHEIWKEHVKTSIVRSVVESARPRVQRARRAAEPAGVAMVVCPEEEYHDLGARMGADFFSLAGYRTLFIGCNTPTASILDAAAAIRPDVVAISVANPLNLVALQRIVRALRRQAPGVQIAVAGSAFATTNISASEFGVDRMIRCCDDVLALRGAKP